MPRVANHLRNQVLELCYRHGGHASTAFSCVEILVALYHGGILRVDPSAPEDLDRDRFLLSKGHGETILYAVLADLGFFPEDWLWTHYRSGDHRLGGHVDHQTPGIETTSGALGHGLGLACGLTLAARMDGQARRHVVLMGDAECSEGSVWEAALFAAQWGLGRLTAIVDRNHIGSLDHTRNYLALEPFAAKWEAFGWEVVPVDGHDLTALDKALSPRGEAEGKPRLVLAETVKGKGCRMMENDPIWHVRPVTDDVIAQCREDLTWTGP
ncbi:MAG: transketolase [Rhodospirillum sp.]|nr:transketolase [Rhodospirillum sp.]MCF8487630.1 transketolase [Rhodospirillum sp.]MCF8499234.1 transketolase [Rhodospirillum sp.]